MTTRRATAPAKYLFNGCSVSSKRTSRCFVRSITTEATTPTSTLAQSHADAQLSSTSTEPILKDQVYIPPLRQTIPSGYRPPPNPFITDAICTTYRFPSLEPTGFVKYPSTHLLLPLRKDILHRAVVFEADAARGWSTKSTKWRKEVHGSGRKIRPQKGTGSARLGDKKSPMLRGGGVAHGPKPRDFTTELPRKIYDLAVRTALSYRYRQGELIVTDGEADIQVHEYSASRYMEDMMEHNALGSSGGRTLFVNLRKGTLLSSAFEPDYMIRHGKVRAIVDIKVKDLLGFGTVVIERDALERLLQEHESDLPGTTLRSWANANSQSLYTATPKQRRAADVGKNVRGAHEDLIARDESDMETFEDEIEANENAIDASEDVREGSKGDVRAS